MNADRVCKVVSFDLSDLYKEEDFMGNYKTYGAIDVDGEIDRLKTSLTDLLVKKFSKELRQNGEEKMYDAIMSRARKAAKDYNKPFEALTHAEYMQILKQDEVISGLQDVFKNWVDENKL